MRVFAIQICPASKARAGRNEAMLANYPCFSKLLGGFGTARSRVLVGLRLGDAANLNGSVRSLLQGCKVVAILRS